MELSRDKVKEIINDDWLLMDDCEGNKNCDVVKELARIALASLEAEAVAWRYRTTDINGNPNPNWSFSEEASLLGLYQPLYAAPPAPTTVPAAYEHTEDFSEYHEGWNACRAAVLQGADGSYPVIPDDLIRRIAFSLVYLAADEKLRSDEDSLFALVRQGIDVVRRELAAPQQEVK